MKQFDIILLLGMRLYDDGTADPTTIGRVKKAAELWKRGLAPIIVASGGQGYNESHDRKQADVMAELLIEEGVPNEAIIREDQSRSTVFNVEYTKKILDRKTFTAAVVTTDWHMPRSLLICRQRGVIAEGFPVESVHDESWRARKRLERIYTFETRIGWVNKNRPAWVNPIRNRIIKKDKAIANQDFARYNAALRKEL